MSERHEEAEDRMKLNGPPEDWWNREERTKTVRLRGFTLCSRTREQIDEPFKKFWKERDWEEPHE